MIVNVALSSSSINSPATFPINRRLNVAGLPNPFLLHYRKINGSMFPSFLWRKITGGGRIVAAVDMDKAEKKTGPVRIVGIVGEGSVSPLKSTPWLDVMLHTVERLKWVDEEFEMIVFSDNFVKSEDETVKHVSNELDRADILVVVAARKEGSVNWIQSNSQNVPNIICFDSSLALRNKLGGSFVETKKRGDIFSSLLPFSQSKKLDESVEITRTVFDAWERHNSDDIRFCLLVIINAYITPVSTLKNLRAKGFSTLNCMVTNCGSQILNCLLDPNCRKALQCLNNCSPVDQVCNYRCIASYESKYLEEFSLCVLQRNNCLELDAKIPEKPYVTPMAEFRGEKLSTEIAEDLFVGWLRTLEWSWRVVAGQNPAYDQFPCQYQLFYRGKARGSFWYEPVFQVKTLEGDLVWRRRKYRVKRGKVTGTFHFSVLDNGVVSNEFWTIVDVSDDLSWGLFHYHGAARVAGQSYTGAVLVSPDGQYPAEKEKQRLISALDRCGIKEWELFNVDNCSCENAPLGIPDGSSLHSKIQVNEQTHSTV
ncbi:hypothetical protein KY290_021851 [Solanum tuberosum]|uniref:VDE lipocalin domain-containing protein n=1 Tax=Solanum tuberosum TaxID=4113 RepID=A0ABQ7V2Q5_SOLTU|nr:hypothetical protein KY289_021015 [Solanum tuberosum]KAH0758358.1 hypothetical protein KY290_021851 [Solanum tuberosum]